MKSSAQILIILLSLFLVVGCSMFRTQPTGTLFVFDYEGETYEIAGYGTLEGESANFLVYRDGEDIIFRVMDRNRTGVLDRVVSGSVSIEEANRIYRAGIQIAMMEDQFKSIDLERTYEIKSDDYRLVVESYPKHEGLFQNRFIIYDLNWSIIGIYWDEESNGKIDSVISGEMDMEKVQELYTVILQRAEKKGKLQQSDDNKFIIVKKAFDKSVLAGVGE